jgi:hypothetical protein
MLVIAMRRSSDPPIVLVKWYDATKWILERVDSFPKNQRFIQQQRQQPAVVEPQQQPE